MRLGVREVIERGLVLRASFQGPIRHIWPDVLLIVVQIRKLPPPDQKLVKYSHSRHSNRRSLIALFPPPDLQNLIQTLTMTSKDIIER
jgi:hypothetical protein